MDEKLLNSYLDKVDELIAEEDKIVTYKSLSNSLGIHINTSKQLLYTYLSQKKKEKFPVCATFLIAGKLKDGTLNITIVNENNKEAEVSKFIEITSDHVYSVQKGKSLKDIKVLCGVGKENKKKESQYVIKCFKSIVSKTSANVNSFKESEEKKNNTKCTVKGTPEIVTQSVGSIEVKKPEENREKLDSNLNENNSKSPKKLNVSDSKPKVEKKQNNVKLKNSTGNIANFFANAAQKSSLKSDKNLGNDPKSSENNSIKNIHNVCEEKNLKKNKLESEEEKIICKKKTKKKNEVNKRKRIQVMSDSDDSDSSNNSSIFIISSSNEEVLEQDPDLEETIKILQGSGESEEESKSQNKRKKRKIIDSTIMNEDGYLETKKEITLVTDSEDEGEEKTLSKTHPFQKKDLKIDVKRVDTNASNASKKQTTLLTFFKKN